MKLVTLTLAAGLAAMSAAAPALADPIVRSQPVEFAPAELASEAGRAAITERIEDAAREVCNARGATTPEVQRLEQECERRALRDAFARLDALQQPRTLASASR